jgi:katanin p80 WD40 repeat-containing subunit B1
MTAGKMIHSIQSHTSAITSLCFNPSEFVLASVSTSLIQIHDLQTFECVSSINVEQEPFKHLIFHPEGEDLLALSDNVLQVLL